jgi:hypothetical protein
LYVDGVILAALRHYLPTTNIYSKQPADVLAVLPCVVASSYGGSDAVPEPREAGPSIQVDCYAADRRPASVLADQVASAGS